ncbi:MAG TPA: hypothetical protein PKH88_07010, partial [Paludibacteraceae bacterium]|nr:hypothetical protein [Paludibacteraceae bacterium]
MGAALTWLGLDNVQYGIVFPLSDTVPLLEPALGPYTLLVYVWIDEALVRHYDSLSIILLAIA